MKDLLHVYAQAAEHDSVMIAGDRRSVERLRNVLDSALKAHDGQAESPKDQPFFVNDGEGFSVRVMVVAPDSEKAASLALPYRRLVNVNGEVFTDQDLKNAGQDWG